MSEGSKRPFELKGVFVAAVSYDVSGDVRKFRVLDKIWINVISGSWHKINKAGDEFRKGARIDVKGVQLNGTLNKLETGYLAANVIFLHDGLKPGRKRMNEREIEE